MTKLFSVSTIATLCTASLSLVACAPPAEESPDTQSQTALEEAAAVVADLVNDASFRAELQRQLEARVTGDFEVLVDDIADLELSNGDTLGNALEWTGVRDTTKDLHIAAPLGVDWGGELPWVAASPASEDDDAEITYFAPDGDAVSLVAGEVPEFPVLFVGQNERIGRSNVMKDADDDEILPAATSKLLKIKRIMIDHDHEPWHKGDPEIYMECLPVNLGTYGRADLPSVNEEMKWYTLTFTFWGVLYEKPLIRIYSSHGDHRCYVKEEDGGLDLDDVLGSTIVRYSDANNKRYYVRDATFDLYW